MSAQHHISILGPDPRVLAWIGELAAKLSALPEIPQCAVEIIQRSNGVVPFGLYLDLCPTGRAGEFRTALKVSNALRDFGLAVGTGDLDLEFVGEGHRFISIGSVATSDVAHPAAQDLSRAPRVALSSGGAA